MKHVAVSDDIHSLLMGINKRKKESKIDYNEILEYIFFGINRETLNYLISYISKMKSKNYINTKLPDSPKHIKISDELHSLLYQIKTMKGIKYNDIIEPIIFGLGWKNFQTIYSRIYYKKNPSPIILIEDMTNLPY